MKIKILFIFVTLLSCNSNIHGNLLHKAYEISYKRCKNSQKEYFKCDIGRKKERELTITYFKEAETIHGKYGHDTWAKINKYVHDNIVAFHKNEFKKEKFFKPSNRIANIKVNHQNKLANRTNSKKEQSNSYSRKTFQDMSLVQFCDSTKKPFSNLLR